ncbi:MAG TPA: glycosyltransferase family 2 protein, partial [Candidatus Dormibacteraeota bacterium]|nr:glycosyltransferase family 2 protein [Candidatus Dormibacteraeota bacterium]
MAADVTIVVVAYNTEDWCRACLRSVFDETRGVDFEVVVVDNASADGTVAMIRREFPAVRLIAETENTGFARAVNRAAATSTGRHLLLLNPDCIVQGGALQRLVTFADAHPGHGVYGGRTLRTDGALEPSSCWGAQSPWSLFCFATGLSTVMRGSRLFDPESLGGWRRDSVREVGVVTGCLLLVPRTVWDSLGGFDPDFFMYGEDADLCIRAARRGWRPVITPAATVTHATGQSSPRPERVVLVMKSRATLLRKHWQQPRRGFGLAMLLAGVSLRAAGSAALEALSGRAHPHQATWRRVWRARRDWFAGFPSAD